MSFSMKPVAAALSLALVVGGGAAQAAPKRPTHPAAQPATPAAPQQEQQQPAQQGQQQPQGPIHVDLQAAQGEANWTKVCGKDPVANKEICYTTRDFGQDPTHPFFALAVYEVKGEDTRIVRLLLPLGFMLKPGFRFSVDKGAMLPGEYAICMQNGCFAEAQVKAAAIDTMKKGTVLNVAVKNSVNNDVTFGVPLQGFGQAFDGAPIDPKVLQAEQQRFQQELQKKAEEERKRIESQQAGAAGAPGAAPAQAPAAQK